ncbi:hypothetical protein HYH03_017044 [Edaphochlamys debaryana]|uniref:SUEL-type lectin domain-containing protein n=1 Tax=Edaphochlamys debaryana TaxID=47281 RepID=A0A835XJW1_9CHLO|nr:hypothetical protein HYH03_017044 [Edaphochlamys debaryana]|eukprot:KAG2484163.1 hypothetical protein HYH03_017044 [Edaphochlamys debaryana]
MRPDVTGRRAGPRVRASSQRRLSYRRHGPREVAGEEPLLAGIRRPYRATSVFGNMRRRTASIRTATDVQLYRLRRAHFLRLCPPAQLEVWGLETALVCERSTANLSCPPGTVITTESALYGRVVGATDCGGASVSTECRASGTAAFVIANCDGRQSCYVNATSQAFGSDPCPGTAKYLNVSYSCIDPCKYVYAGPDAPVPDGDRQQAITLAAAAAVGTNGAACVGGEVSAIQVSVNMTHPCVGDLEIRLSSGEINIFLSKMPSVGDYYCNLVNGLYTFAVDPSLINIGTLFPRTQDSPLVGTTLSSSVAYAPSQSLLLLLGESAAGPWELIVADIGPGDVGVVHSFEVLVRVGTPVLDSAGCGALQETFRFVPGSGGWGSAPARQQKLWADSGCEPEKICRYWQQRYQVVPYASWGTLPAELQEAWSDYLACNRLFPEPVTCVLGYTGPPAPIPDGDPSTGVTLTATNSTGCAIRAVDAVRVAVNLTHTCLGDLTLRLSSGSASVTLSAVTSGTYYCSATSGRKQRGRALAADRR